LVYLKLRVELMILEAKYLSPDQRATIEGLLGRSVAEDEAISLRATELPAAPDWLQSSWQSARQLGLDQLSMEEIDAEIAAARAERRSRQDTAER